MYKTIFQWPIEIQFKNLVQKCTTFHRYKSWLNIEIVYFELKNNWRKASGEKMQIRNKIKINEKKKMDPSECSTHWATQPLSVIQLGQPYLCSLFSTYSTFLTSKNVQAPFTVFDYLSRASAR
jgi:hypothetical protein